MGVKDLTDWDFRQMMTGASENPLVPCEAILYWTRKAVRELWRKGQKPTSMADVTEMANILRRKQGLPPLRLPPIT